MKALRINNNSNSIEQALCTLFPALRCNGFSQSKVSHYNIDQTCPKVLFEKIKYILANFSLQKLFKDTIKAYFY